MKEELVRKYENANRKVAKHSKYLRVHTLTPSAWHVDDILKELKQLTIQDLQEYLSVVLKNVHMEALVYGNMTSEDAMALCKEIRGTVGASTLHAADRKLPQCLKLSPGYCITTEPSKNPREENSGIEAYFQCGQDNLESRAKLDFIEQICDEPCFNVLRTKEQLGYLVRSTANLTYGVLGFTISIVSERFPPYYLESRVEEFLQTFEKSLVEMSDEELEQHRTSLIETKLEKEKNLAETSGNLWLHIASRRYDFDAKPLEVQTIGRLTKQDLLEWYKDNISPTNKERKKFSFCVICPGHQATPEATPLGEEYKEIKDLKSVRAESEVFPDPSILLQ